MDRSWMAVAAGGFLGACARYAIKLIGIRGTVFPMEILFINLAGAFCLAFFLEVTLDRIQIPRDLRLGIGTGFIGAFTTFSTLCQEADALYRSPNPMMGSIYLAVSVIGGILFAVGGMVLGRRMGAPERREESA